MKNETRIINNRYIIKDIIGQGGMGIVYKASDTLKANQYIALKTIRKNLLNEKSLEVFKREFEVMTRLKHPNLIKVFDFGHDTSIDSYYLTMEIISGKNLAEIIKDKKSLRLKEILSVMIPALRGLSYIHSRNIIYRDVKPSNIIIGRNTLKLMDFGLSDIGKADIHTIKGSPLYLAPEVFHKRIDNRIDIYALGIVFYQMITGSVFIGLSDVSNLISTLTDNRSFEKISKISLQKIKNKNLQSIISKMTTFEPDKRYSNSIEVIKDINLLLKKEYPIETDETSKSYVLGIGFTNRKREINSIRKFIHTEHKHKKIFLLRSPLGIGKSRIFYEVKKYCQLNDILFFETECYENISKQYFAISNIIRQAVLHTPERLKKKYKKNIDELFRISLENVRFIRSQSTKKDIQIEGLSNYLYELNKAIQEKIIIYINNINWMDEDSSAIILEYLRKSHKDEKSNIYIFSSLRADYDQDLPDNIKIFKKEKLLKLINIQPFTKEHIFEFIDNIFGIKNTDHKIFDIIESLDPHNAGNPFYLTEIFKTLIHNKIIRRKKILWTVIENADFPTSITEIIKNRISNVLLDRDSKTILHTLSVLRVGLTLKDIEKLFHNLNNKKIKKLIYSLEYDEILKAEHIATKIYYYFSHSLIQEIVEKEIEDKTLLHKYIGDRFELMFSNIIDDFTEELAYHYSQSMDSKKAIYYLIKSGKIGEARYASTEDIIFYYSKALKIATDINDFQSIADIKTMISLIKIEDGDFRNARIGFEESKELYKKLSKNEKNIAMIDNHIGVLYQRQGKFEDSLKFLKKSCDKLNKDGYGSDLEMGTVFNNMGMTNLQYGRFDNALKYFKQSLEIRLKHLGEFNLEVSKCYHNIAVTFMQKSHIEGKKDLLRESISYFKKAQSILKKLKIYDHNTAFLWHNMSIAYAYNKQNKLSYKYLMNAFNLRLRILGKYHRDTAHSYINIGVYYTDIKDYETAYKYFENARDILLKKYGRYNPFIAITINNMGECLLKLKEFIRAEDLLKQSLRIRKKTLGIQNHMTFRSYIQLLKLHKSKKDQKKLKSYGRHVLKIYKNIATKDDLNLIRSYIPK